MKRNLIVVMALTAALALSSLAPAIAKGGPSLERGNWLSGVAEPVALTSDDVRTITLANGTEYVVVDHGIATDHDGYTTLVQREPARYKQNVVTYAPANFDSAWLGVTGPKGTSIGHKGELNWYYEVADGEWVSLTFAFNGKGKLLHVNGVTP